MPGGGTPSSLTGEPGHDDGEPGRHDGVTLTGPSKISTTMAASAAGATAQCCKTCGLEADCPSHARLGTGGMTPVAMVGSRALAPVVAPRPMRVEVLLARTDDCTVRDYVRHNVMALHRSQENQGLLVLLVLLARTADCTVRDYFRHDAKKLHRS